MAPLGTWGHASPRWAVPPALHPTTCCSEIPLSSYSGLSHVFTLTDLLTLTLLPALFLFSQSIRSLWPSACSLPSVGPRSSVSAVFIALWALDLPWHPPGKTPPSGTGPALPDRCHSLGQTPLRWLSPRMRALRRAFGQPGCAVRRLLADCPKCLLAALPAARQLCGSLCPPTCLGRSSTQAALIACTLGSVRPGSPARSPGQKSCRIRVGTVPSHASSHGASLGNTAVPHPGRPILEPSVVTGESPASPLTPAFPSSLPSQIRCCVPSHLED